MLLVEDTTRLEAAMTHATLPVRVAAERVSAMLSRKATASSEPHADSPTTALVEEAEGVMEPDRLMVLAVEVAITHHQDTK
jgi:hypothetical protein